MGKHYLDTLPRTARAPLDDLAKALKAILEDQLVSIVVHGSAARGDYKEQRSDLDVIIVLKDTSRELLERIANPIAIARTSGRVETMILTEEEIDRASDVFPLFYDDVKRTHAVLFGSDPFENLTISDSHRRLRIEQELREAQIRLRRAVVDARGDERALTQVVTRKLRQLRFPLHAMLELLGIEVQSHKLDIVLSRACKHLAVDSADLLRADKKPRASHAALVSLLTKAIDLVDRLEDPKPTEVREVSP